MARWRRLGAAGRGADRGTARAGDAGGGDRRPRQLLDALAAKGFDAGRSRRAPPSSTPSATQDPGPSSACGSSRASPSSSSTRCPTRPARTPTGRRSAIRGRSPPRRTPPRRRRRSRSRGLGRDGDARAPTSASSARAPAAPCSRPAAPRPARTCSCSRRAATATSRTSSSSSCRATWSSTTAPASPPRNRLDLGARRADARRRHRRQLHELRAHARADACASGPAHGLDGLDDPAFVASTWTR